MKEGGKLVGGDRKKEKERKKERGRGRGRGEAWDIHVVQREKREGVREARRGCVRKRVSEREREREREREGGVPTKKVRRQKETQR